MAFLAGDPDPSYPVTLSAAITRRLYTWAVRLAALRGIPRPDDSPWVITGSKRDRPLHDLHYWWKRIQVRTRLDGVRIHDLCNCYASGPLLGDEVMVAALLLRTP